MADQVIPVEREKEPAIDAPVNNPSEDFRRNVLDELLQAASPSRTIKAAEPAFLVFAGDKPKEGSSRGLEAPSDKPQATAKSPAELADSVMALKKANAGGAKETQLENKDLKESLVASIQKAYGEGGMAGANKFVKEVNDKIVGPFGPMLKYDGDGKATLSMKEQDPKNKADMWDLAKPVQFDLETKKDVAVVKDDNIRSGKPKDADAAPLASAYGAVKAFDLLKAAGVGNWKSNNGNQDQLLDMQAKLSGDLGKIPKDVIDGLASKDVTKLNEFLKAKGYDIKLNPMGADGIGVVTSTEIEGQWAGKNHGKIRSDGKDYDAFKLKTSNIYKVDGNTVAKIYDNPDTGIKVFVAPYSGKAAGLDAVEIAKKMTPGEKAAKDGDYNAVVLPKVDLDRKSQLDWLKGMSSDKGFTVRQAVAQTKVQMDENGFKAKEGLAVAVSRGISPPDSELTFDKPFMFWVQKDGVSMPLFATTIDQSSWKAPKK